MGASCWRSDNPLKPHAVTATNGIINASYTYDANGNQDGGSAVTVGYTAFDKPHQITRGSASVAFSYDADNQRLWQNRSDGGGALYLSGVGISSEIQWDASGWAYVNYIVAGGEVVAQRVHHSSQGTKTLYFHKDQLGSVSTITNDAGFVIERLSYDSWGKPRHSNGTDDPAGALTSSARRGFSRLLSTPEVACWARDARRRRKKFATKLGWTASTCPPSPPPTDPLSPPARPAHRPAAIVPTPAPTAFAGFRAAPSRLA